MLWTRVVVVGRTGLLPWGRGLARLGVVGEADDPHEVRSHLERAVPKNRGTEFVDLMEELTHDTCVAGPPDCPRCDLRKICPTGQARLVSDKAAARSAARVKPDLAPPAPAAPAKAAAKLPPVKTAPVTSKATPTPPADPPARAQAASATAKPVAPAAKDKTPNSRKSK